MASKILSSIANLFVSFHFHLHRKMLMNLNEKVIIQQNTIVLGSYITKSLKNCRFEWKIWYENIKMIWKNWQSQVTKSLFIRLFGFSLVNDFFHLQYFDFEEHSFLHSTRKLIYAFLATFNTLKWSRNIDVSVKYSSIELPIHHSFIKTLK